MTSNRILVNGARASEKGAIEQVIGGAVQDPGGIKEVKGGNRHHPWTVQSIQHNQVRSRSVRNIGRN